MLIAFEGIDGAGKSTQASLLQRWLSKQAHTILTHWNSSRYIAPATKQAKQDRALTPAMFSLFHAADFAHRHDEDIAPELRQGATVIADRYYWTAFTRDTERGCLIDWVRGIYQFATTPDIAFYIRVSAEEALSRKDKRPNWYESGRDIYPECEAYAAFCKYQGALISRYESMLDEFTVIDGAQSVKAIQKQIRLAVLERMNKPERAVKALYQIK